MLIYDSSDSLGDKRIGLTEGLAKIKEDNQKLIDTKKLPGQALLENKDMAIGRAMHTSEFIRIIQKLNPKIIVEKGGYPGCVAVRYPTWNEDEKEMQKKYISGFPAPATMQEFSNITVDAKGLPHREVRGWKSVLLALVKAGILTHSQCTSAFGESNGQRSILWHQQLRDRK